MGSKHPFTGWWKPLNWWEKGFALLLLLGGLLATGVSETALASAFREKVRVDFLFLSHDVQKNIADRMSACVQLLRSGAAFFSGSQTVSREEWHEFVAGLRLDLSLPGIQGLGFSQWIPGDALTDHQTRLRNQGNPGYVVRPAGNRAEYSSIIFLEPYDERNQRAFGFDMLSEPVRRAAMEQARDSGNPALSGKVVLVQENSVNVQAGTLMYLPVYRSGAALDTVEQRRAALLGWVYSPYRMGDLMTGTLGLWLATPAGERVGLEIFDGSAPTPEALLFENLNQDDRARLGQNLNTETFSLTVADRVWTLRFTQPYGVLQFLDRVLVVFIGVFGLGLSVLMFALALSVLSARARAVQLAKNLTMVNMPSGFQYCRMIYEGEQPVDWEYLIVNHAFATQTGLGEVSGKKASEVIPRLRIDDPGLFELFGRVARGGGAERGEVFLTSLGKWFEYSVYSPARDHFVVISDRIDDRIQAQTQLQHSEARLRDVIERSASASYKRALNANRYEYMSPVIEQLTGYPVSKFEGMSLGEVAALIHPDDRGSVADLVASAVPQTPYEVEYRLLDARGEYRWFNDKFTLAGGTTETPSLIGNLTDVTATKKAEAEREELEKRRRQFERTESLGRMASSVAHLFNNHLQAVLSNLELVRVGSLRGDKHLADARVSVGRAAEVSQLLLTYLGQSPAERVTLDFSALCHRALGEFRATLPPGVLLIAQLPSLPVIVRGNAELLVLAVSNLLANAREASGDDGRIEVTLETQVAKEVETLLFPSDWRPGAASAVLQIRDNGVGIAPADLPKLADPFFSTKAMGRGLGVPVVVGVLQTHEGALALESQEGAGSTFRLILPLTSEPLPLTGDEPTAIGRQAGTVLFVDDDEAVREVTGELIGLLGYRVLTAAGGQEALELVDRHSDELMCVVTDLSMPNMDGWELLALIRQRDPGLPVLMVSGFDASQAMTGDHEMQPDGFMSKPFGLRPLQDSLAKLVQARRRA